MPKIFRFMVVVVLSMLLPCTGFAEDWPQWRGPTRNGAYHGRDWPKSLQGNALEKMWSIPLGPSYSGPIAFGNRIFTTETSKKENEAVYAYDRETGEEMWKVEWKGALSVPFFALSNGSWIRATPACDGQTLYVAGMRDVLVALDVSTGQERWRLDFMEKFKSPLPAFGFVASPLIEGEHLYVQAGAGVVKVNKHTGTVVWRNYIDAGGMQGSAFASPVITEVCGVRQLVVQAREKLAGLSLDDGSTYWEQTIPSFRGMNIMSPTVVNDMIFSSSYGGKTLGMKVVKQIGEQDKNLFRVENIWSDNAQGYMSSPVVIGEKVYLHLRNQRFACFDLVSGQKHWTTEPFGKYWSLIHNGQQILALDERGELLLINAKPEAFELVDRRKISEEETWAHLALADDQIFIRELNALTCYRWRELETKAK